MLRSTIKARFTIALALLCTGFIFGLISLIVQSKGSYDTAYAQNLIRLHVIANSNTPKDQDLKLLVRDGILQEAETILKEVEDRERAYLLLSENKERLERRAQEVVFQEGFEYPVAVKLGEYVFPYREYGSMAVPAGNYDAVRVEIGAAVGDNWWCVLFPPLCLAELEGAKKNLLTLDKTGDSGNKFVFRFKLLEHIAETKYAQRLQKWWQVSAAGLTIN